MSKRPYPRTALNYSRVWKSSEILPLLTQIAIERMTCSDNYYASGGCYRVLVNSSPQLLIECRNESGKTCHAKDFKEFVRERVERFGDYADWSGLNDAAQDLTIYETGLEEQRCIFCYTTNEESAL